MSTCNLFAVLVCNWIISSLQLVVDERYLTEDVQCDLSDACILIRHYTIHLTPLDAKRLVSLCHFLLVLTEFYNHF